MLFKIKYHDLWYNGEGGWGVRGYQTFTVSDLPYEDLPERDIHLHFEQPSYIFSKCRAQFYQNDGSWGMNPYKYTEFELIGNIDDYVFLNGDSI